MARKRKAHLLRILIDFRVYWINLSALHGTDCTNSQAHTLKEGIWVCVCRRKIYGFMFDGMLRTTREDYKDKKGYKNKSGDSWDIKSVIHNESFRSFSIFSFICIHLRMVYFKLSRHLRIFIFMVGNKKDKDLIIFLMRPALKGMGYKFHWIQSMTDLNDSDAGGTGSTVRKLNNATNR